MPDNIIARQARLIGAISAVLTVHDLRRLSDADAIRRIKELLGEYEDKNAELQLATKQENGVSDDWITREGA